MSNNPSANPKNGHRLNNMHWFVREIDGDHDLFVSDVLGIRHILQPRLPHDPFGTARHVLRGQTALVGRGQNGHGAKRVRPRSNRALVRRAAEYVGATDLS